MKPKEAGLLAAAVVLIGAAGLFAMRWVGESRSHPDFPDGIHWKCLNPECGAGYTTSHGEMTAYYREHSGARSVACPKCGGEETTRAVRCPHCGEYAVPSRDPDQGSLCPSCGEDMAKKPAK